MKYTLGDEDIKNNIVVLSGFEFVEQRPFGFFEFKNPNEKDNVFKKKVLGDYDGKLSTAPRKFVTR